ncbi:MAG: hypothetical protein ABJN69_01175 [Hellea sp.]
MSTIKYKFEKLENFNNQGESKLGFVFDCLLAGAITIEELKQWCIKVIESEKEPHTIFFDLLDFIDSLPRLYIFFRDKNIRSPYIDISEGQSLALTGIGFLRNIRLHEDNARQKDKSLKALKQHGEILDVFKSEFPFVDF